MPESTADLGCSNEAMTASSTGGKKGSTPQTLTEPSRTLLKKQSSSAASA